MPKGNPQDSMPKVDFVKDKANLNQGELDYIRLIERQNRERVLKLQKLRRANLWTAGIIGAGVFSIYLYSMLAVKQENFLDDFNEPARENTN
jgi:hypothetical protein